MRTNPSAIAYMRNIYESHNMDVPLWMLSDGERRRRAQANTTPAKKHKKQPKTFGKNKRKR